MKTKFEIVEDYIDYFNDRDSVNKLTIPEQVLYKCMIADTLSFKFYELRIRLNEFIEIFISSLKGDRK